MVTLLAKLFIKPDCKDKRQAYGVLCGITGILFNLLLFAFKLAAGTLSGSIAITADAFNNLSDSGSSVITLLGFKLAGQKPDRDHPFGHGRFEYLSGLFVAIAIIVMGFELLKTSVEKLINPQPVEFSMLGIAVLGVSILVKLYMWRYNK
ncbi:MAG: cation diffusion facilitator family transporter, partial [Angelakisella sp.]